MVYAYFLTLNFKSLETPVSEGLVGWCASMVKWSKKQCSKAFVVMELGKSGLNPHLHVVAVPLEKDVSRKNFRRRVAFAVYGKQDVSKTRLKMQEVRDIENCMNVVNGYMSKEEGVVHLTENPFESLYEEYVVEQQAIKESVENVRRLLAVASEQEEEVRKEYEEEKCFWVDDYQKAHLLPEKWDLLLYRTESICVLSMSKYGEHCERNGRKYDLKYS